MLDKYESQGLHVLLVELQDHKRDEIVPFMAQAWTGKVPMGVLGAGSPFRLAGNGLPQTALVGVDGSIVWTLDGGGSCEKNIEEQLAKMHQVKPLDGALKGVTKDLNSRNFGKVVTAARGIAEKGPNDKAKESAASLVEQLTKTVDARFAMSKRMVDAGRPQKALNLLKQLSKQVAGDKDWTDKVAAQVKEIESGSKDDLAADKVVTESEELMKDKGGRVTAATKLADVLKKYPSVKVAKLAEDLKKAAESKGALR